MSSPVRASKDDDKEVLGFKTPVKAAEDKTAKRQTVLDADADEKEIRQLGGGRTADMQPKKAPKAMKSFFSRNVKVGPGRIDVCLHLVLKPLQH
jgi:hypothetical protein